ncbi:hypothetical protein [Roseococcus pinisoli]|uniref:Uncharacterized protein n=1 Tax=Roseococcus pinisoli TaxID=2835040 RepID=A0ABS5QBV2_9PROT|nr:hypothetical protein [Roseococcus pinisoli]MBS7811170.1 hypothetical protein [Roseococcus pinisoli]
MAGDAVREALEAATRAICPVLEGDAGGGMCRDCQLDSLRGQRDSAECLMHTHAAAVAIAAFLRALPEGYVEIERESDGICYPQQLGMTDQHAKLLAAAVDRAGGDDDG